MPLPKFITISEHAQGTEGWHAERIGRFTASRAGDIMLTTRTGAPTSKRKDYIMELALERITGHRKEIPTSKAMQNGIDTEATAALAYSFKTGNAVVETNLHIHSNGYSAASPDRVHANYDGTVEIKCPLPDTHFQTLKSQEIPRYYYWQNLQQIWHRGARFSEHVSYCPDFPENAQLVILRIDAEDPDVKQDILRLQRELEIANSEVEEHVKFILEYRDDN